MPPPIRPMAAVRLHHRSWPDCAGRFMYVDEDLRDVNQCRGCRHHRSNEGYVAVFSTRLDF